MLRFSNISLKASMLARGRKDRWIKAQLQRIYFLDIQYTNITFIFNYAFEDLVHCVLVLIIVIWNTISHHITSRLFPSDSRYKICLFCKCTWFIKVVKRKYAMFRNLVDRCECNQSKCYRFSLGYVHMLSNTTTQRDKKMDLWPKFLSSLSQDWKKLIKIC